MFYRLLFGRIRDSLLAHIIEKRKGKLFIKPMFQISFSFPAPISTLVSNPRSWNSSIREGGINSLNVKYDFLRAQFNSFHLLGIYSDHLCLRHNAEHVGEQE